MIVDCVCVKCSFFLYFFGTLFSVDIKDVTVCVCEARLSSEM